MKDLGTLGLPCITESRFEPQWLSSFLTLTKETFESNKLL